MTKDTDHWGFMMHAKRADTLDSPVELGQDHVLGALEAEITLVEYGSHVCSYCHADHEVIRHLRDQFGDRMRYVCRHLPLADRAEATRAAELAEYESGTSRDTRPSIGAGHRRTPRNLR
jgi:NhaA family Na+:H+ antiporter